MSQPGWYPDPAGQPGQFRFWDGVQWSHETSPTPQAPPPHPGHGAPSGGGSTGWIAAVVAVVVLALVAWFVVKGMGGDDVGAGGEDTNTSTPTVSGWDETSTPSPTPTPTEEPEPSGATMIDCPAGTSEGEGAFDGDRMRSGQMSVTQVGWGRSRYPINWIHNPATELKTITATWVNISQIGELKKSDGFDSPAKATKMLMSCFATSFAYTGFSGRKDVTSEAVTIDGHQGHRLSTEVYVANQGDITGDLVEIVVVDTGDPERLGVWVGTATLGRSELISDLERARQSLKVG